MILNEKKDVINIIKFNVCQNYYSASIFTCSAFPWNFSQNPIYLRERACFQYAV